MSLWVVDGGMVNLPVVARVEEWCEGDFIELSGDDGGKWGEPVRYVAERTCHVEVVPNASFGKVSLDCSGFRCSECGQGCVGSFGKYCPNCGARVVDE